MSDQAATRKGIFDDETYRDAVEVLKSCLKATKPVKAGRNTYREVEDWKLRKEAALAIIEQESGKATSKQEITMQGRLGSGEKQLSQAELMDQARKDPAMAARIAASYVENLKSIEAAD